MNRWYSMAKCARGPWPRTQRDKQRTIHANAKTWMRTQKTMHENAKAQTNENATITIDENAKNNN